MGDSTGHESEGLTRRGFVGVAAGAGAAVAVGGLAWWRPWDASERVDVVVVGAGLAGLTAAYELREAGRDVVVVEARDRVGGRVRTLREPLSGGQHAELGGEFIDGVHSTIRGYVRRFELGLEDLTMGGGRLSNGVYRNGNLQALGAALDPRERREMDRFWTAVAKLGSGLDYRNPVPAAGAIDRRSVADLLDAERIDGIARLVLDSYVRDEYGVSPGEASLLNLVALEKVYENVPEGQIEIYRVDGGNDRLTGAFAERLGDAVRLRSPVSSIEQRSDGVSVEAGGDSIEADYVIVAAPLPALRAISFDPPFDEPLRSAVEDLQYGRVTKTLLQYPSRFWRALGYNGDVIADVPEVRTWEATERQPEPEGILIDYLAAERNDLVAPMSHEERARLTAAGIAKVFPDSPDPGATGSAAWQLEPYSGGCWGSPAPGQVTGYWRALRRAQDRLHLAGEHTDTVFSTYMEGAVRSGRRAAREVETRLQNS